MKHMLHETTVSANRRPRRPYTEAMAARQTGARRHFISAVVGVLAALVVAPLPTAAARQSPKPRSEQYSAIAVLPPDLGSPTPITLYIDRWSTDAENDRLLNGLKELGTKGVMQALAKLPEVGSL